MQRRNKLKISHRFILALAVILGLTFWLGVFALQKMQEIDGQVRTINETWMPATRLAAEMKAELFDFRLGEYQRVMAVAPGAIGSAEQRMQSRAAAYQAKARQLSSWLATPDQRSQFNRVGEAMARYHGANETLIGLLREGRPAEALALMNGPSQEWLNAVVTHLDGLIGALVTAGRAAQRTSDELVEAARLGILAACCGIAAIALLAGVLLAGAVYRSVRQLRQVGVSTANSSAQMGVALREQEATVAEQAATTQEITASVKEISATARDLSQNMDQIAQITATTNQQAAASQQGLGRVDQTMREMSEVLTAMVNKLAVLNEKALNINHIVATINKVADRTHLLSLNAAIQAEKAGEAGLGFAVVASEIRRLAEQTAVSTHDIEQILQDIQGSVGDSVLGMDRFAQSIRHNVADVHEISEQLTAVAEQIQSVSAHFESIQEGMHAQSLGSDQISQAMVLFNEGMRQTIDAVHSSQQSIASLSEAIHGMQGVVSEW